MKLGVIIFSMLCASFCHAQNITAEEVLRNADKLFGKINTLSCQYDQEMKYFMDDELNKYTFTAIYERKPQDSLGYYFEIIHFPYLFRYVYGGNDLWKIDQNRKVITILTKETLGVDRIKNYIYTPYDFFDVDFFSSKLKDSLLLDYSMTDSTYKGMEVYALTLNYMDDEEYHDKQHTYYFTKNEFFPIAVDLTVMMYDYLEHNTYQLSNVIINDSIPQDYFNSSEKVPDGYNIKSYSPKSSKPHLPVGTKAPNFKKKTKIGSKFKLKKQRGKIVILDFWYRQCGYCLKLKPYLQKISEKYDTEEVVVIGVNPYDTKEEIIEISGHLNIDYNSVLDAYDVAQDYHISGYPTIYIIDQEGNIADVVHGFDDSLFEKIVNIIDELK